VPGVHALSIGHLSLIAIAGIVMIRLCR
jgi:hypothetical protein